jgi:hypothetical protein
MLERGLGFAVLGGCRTIVARVAMHLAGREIMVGPAQVVPDVVGHLNSQGVAAQAGQGQEKLEDKDSSAHCGADHKDDGHGYLLALSDPDSTGSSLADEKYWGV